MDQYFWCGTIIIVSQLITAILIIIKRNKFLIDNIGPEIDGPLPNCDITEINSGAKRSWTDNGLILFVDRFCGECRMILEKIAADKINTYQMVTSGTQGEVRQFYEQFDFHGDLLYYLTEEDMTHRVGITAFPFYLKVTNGKLIDKGVMDIGLINKQIEDNDGQ